MSSSVKLKNNINSEFTVTHTDGSGAISLTSEQLANSSYTVATVASMEAITATDGQACIVTDLARGGLFIYDSSLVGSDNQGTNFSGWIRQYSGAVNIKWFGAVGDGVTDDTVHIQNAIDFALPTQSIVSFDSGIYLVTDTINIYTGTQIQGNMLGGYTAWASALSEIDASTIKFVPTSTKTLFELSEYDTAFSFKGQCSVSNLRLFGDGTTNSNIAMDLTFSYYNRFNNISISGFETGIYAHATINNRFENLLITQCSLCVDSGTVATTDVFDQCTFNQSDKGVKTVGSIGIRFVNCLAEQLGEDAFDIDATSSDIVVNNLYSEDCPYDATATDPCVFRVGYTGTSNKSAIQLTVSSSQIRGKNSATLGHAFRLKDTDGVVISDTFIRKFDTIFYSESPFVSSKLNVSNLNATAYTTLSTATLRGTYRNKLTDGTNSFRADYTYLYATESNSYANSTSIQTISDKIIPNSDNTRSIGESNKRFSNVYSNRLHGVELKSPSGVVNVSNATTSTQFGGSYIYSGSDNTVSLGLSNVRYSTVYAATGTINTSDDREKTYLTVDDRETLVAKKLKNLVKKFKFKDAIESKGDLARIHYGTSAQGVIEAFEEQELDAMSYAMVCYDEWEEELDEDGNVITEAGNRYGIRYEELIMFILGAM